MVYAASKAAAVIVRDTGFAPDSGTHRWQPLPGNDPVPQAVDLPSDTSPDTLDARLMQATAIRIDFPSFADGRGFTLAKLLRTRGYTGLLRAKGHVIADQYAMARRSGFDEVEIDAALAARQPEGQWLARAEHRSHDYQARLRG
ncbi:MAG: DUF934 domain-containing protein [Shimia sp.]